MTSEVLHVLAELNAGLAFAVLAVLAVRLPVRRRFGPRAAYGLWSAVPLTLIAVCLPRVAADTAPYIVTSASLVGSVLLGGWCLGALACAGWMAAVQTRFDTLARHGLAGPAVTGVIIPRLIMPADSATRWSSEEREMILAHEHAHLARGDLRVNAVVAVLQCLFWCNPLAHVAAARFRFDQELACDATVMAMRRGRRRLYAEALLKTAPAAATPFSCGWTEATTRSLEARMTSLRLPRHAPAPGAALIIACLVSAIAATAWSLQPASPQRVRHSHPPILSLRILPPLDAPPTLERSAAA